MTRDGTVGRSDATEPNLAFHRDIDPVRMMRTRFAHPIRASSPPGLHQQAGHMTASDLCAARQMISCQAGPSTHEPPRVHHAVLLRVIGPILGWADRKGSSDCADEVTLSLKGANSSTRGRKLRSTGMKAKARVSNGPNSLTELKKQLEARTRELAEARGHLSEALEEQSADSEVVKVISRSAFELQLVLDTLVESAVRLCDADHAWLFQREGEFFRWVTSFGHATDVRVQLRDYFKPRKVPVDRGSITGRAAMEARVVHVPDVLADPEYTWSGAQKIGGYRAALGAPLLYKGTVVGVIFVAKTVPQPFTAKQIELVTTFADQAVIAIENTRLLNELRQRTDDLSELLEQQTAASQVLQVISSSTGELEPVFQAILSSATRTCDAKFGLLYRIENGAARIISQLGIPPAFAEYLKRGPHRPRLNRVSPLTPIGRVIQSRQLVHLADYRTDQSYLDPDPMTVAAI